MLYMCVYVLYVVICYMLYVYYMLYRYVYVDTRMCRMYMDMCICMND